MNPEMKGRCAMNGPGRNGCGRTSRGGGTNLNVEVKRDPVAGAGVGGGDGACAAAGCCRVPPLRACPSVSRATAIITRATASVAIQRFIGTVPVD